MLKFLKLSLLLMVISIQACQNQSEVNEEKQLKNEAIQIHDEVMPQMQTVFNLKKRLNNKLDSLESEGAEGVRLYQEIEAAIQELNEANERMMQWMRNFNPRFESEVEQERISYYQTEKEKILNVQDQFSEAIRKAEQVLEKTQ